MVLDWDKLSSNDYVGDASFDVRSCWIAQCGDGV